MTSLFKFWTTAREAPSSSEADVKYEPSTERAVTEENDVLKVDDADAELESGTLTLKEGMLVSTSSFLDSGP